MRLIVTQINGNLPKSYYFLKGGIEIPEGEDLFSDKYKIPGNYYCPNNSRINTLKNCPVNRAFVLKVDLATGTGNLYPRQTFKTLENDIVSRTYDSYGEEWLYQKQVALKSDFFCDRGVITSGDNFNDYTNIGCYRYNGSPENMPEIGTANNWGELCIFKSGNYIVQLGIAALQNIYIRRTTDNVNWTPWIGYVQKSDLSWKHLVNVTTTNPITIPDSANEIFLETLIRKGESYFFDNRVLGKINKGAYQVIRFLFDGYSYYMVNEMGSVHFSNFKVGNDTPDEFAVAVRYR